MVFGQAERYELGKRLQRFELSWEKASPEQREQSMRPMQTAVQSFFQLNLKQAGAKLDEAYQVVGGNSESPSLPKGLLAMSTEVGPVWADANLQEVVVRLRPFYDSSDSLPENGQLLVELIDGQGNVLQQWSIASREALNEQKFSWEKVWEGDGRLRLYWVEGEKKTLWVERGISRSNQAQERLDKVDQAIGKGMKGIAEGESPTLHATGKYLVRLLRSMIKDRPQETDYPADRWLAWCERDLRLEQESIAALRKMAIDEDMWLSLAREDKSVPVRLRAPEVSDKKWPVLFVFHGAGGSENMFFETYGAGRTIELAIEQGYLVVSPQQGILGLALDCQQMLDALEELFPIDRQNVLLLGHSMGAGQVIRQALAHPDLFKAAVAVGGGSAVSKAESLRGIPWLVTAGQFDFGRGGAEALAKSLEKVDAQVRYIEVPKVEHMVIVQASLDEIFAFFNSVVVYHPRDL